MNEKPNLIVDLTFDFALKIIIYTKILEESRRYNMANQLFRSGTSIGANVSEAQHAESKKDFIHKLKVAAKEAEETKYWLSLCENSSSYPNPNSLISELQTIQKIMTKIISTSKNNQ